MRRSSFLLNAAFFLPMLLAPSSARALQPTSLDQYQAHLERLRALVKACEVTASTCDANAVGNDEQVVIKGLGAGANVNSFEAHYDWLRDGLKSARNASNKDRNAALRTVEARLDEALSEAGAAPAQSVHIAEARRAADAILGHPEFATVHQESLWARIWAHVARWLDRIFNHVADFGERSPWIGPLIEWGLIGIALVGLTLWAMRVMRRQRLAVRMEGARQVEAWEEAARNWRALAEEQAARGDWREAVHCLYWASISLLEARRFWTANRSRTPREYVRLLEAGSERWKLLSAQTQGFEYVWYGLNRAAQSDYERALKWHESLRAA